MGGFTCCKVNCYVVMIAAAALLVEQQQEEATMAAVAKVRTTPPLYGPPEVAHAVMRAI